MFACRGGTKTYYLTNTFCKVYVLGRYALLEQCYLYIYIQNIMLACCLLDADSRQSYRQIVISCRA